MFIRSLLYMKPADASINSGTPNTDTQYPDINHTVNRGRRLSDHTILRAERQRKQLTQRPSFRQFSPSFHAQCSLFTPCVIANKARHPAPFEQIILILSGLPRRFTPRNCEG